MLHPPLTNYLDKTLRGPKCSIWRKVLGFCAFWDKIRRWRGRIAFSLGMKFRFL